MEMYRIKRPVMIAFFFGAFLFGTNAYAWKSIDWSISPTGKVSTNREIIEGQIKSFDLEKMEVTFEKNKLLGDEPLRLTKDTECYKGDEKTDIVSVRGGTRFQKADKLNFEHLKAGDFVKCNYTIKDGKFWARRIVLITPYLRME